MGGCHLFVWGFSFAGKAVGVYLGKIAGNTLRSRQAEFSPSMKLQIVVIIAFIENKIIKGIIYAK
jgi:predicted alpha/beta-fold hydrolase